MGIGCYDSPRKNAAVLTYARPGHNGNVRANPCIITYNHIVMNDRERVNGNIFPYNGIGMYGCERLIHRLSFFTICAIISASITTLSPTYPSPFIWQIPLRIGVTSPSLHMRTSPGSTTCLNLTLSIFKKEV